jgi:hypothetical protein
MPTLFLSAFGSASRQSSLDGSTARHLPYAQVQDRPRTQILRRVPAPLHCMYHSRIRPCLPGSAGQRQCMLTADSRNSWATQRTPGSTHMHHIPRGPVSCFPAALPPTRTLVGGVGGFGCGPISSFPGRKSPRTGRSPDPAHGAGFLQALWRMALVVRGLARNTAVHQAAVGKTKKELTQPSSRVIVLGEC